MSHILIICPLKKELNYLMEGFKKYNWSFQKLAFKNLAAYQCQNPMITLALGGHGKSQFAIQTQYLLHHLNEITKVICVGAGGGLSEELNIGDIVIAEKIIEHDYKEKFNFNSKLPEFHSDSELLMLAQKNQLNFSFKVHFGIIASGDEDIVDTKRAQEVIQETKASVVSWEGSGGARACAFNKIPFLEIRTITDNARDFVAENFIKNLQFSMHNAACFIHDLLVSQNT